MTYYTKNTEKKPLVQDIYRIPWPAIILFIQVYFDKMDSSSIHQPSSQFQIPLQSLPSSFPSASSSFGGILRRDPAQDAVYIGRILVLLCSLFALIVTGYQMISSILFVMALAFLWAVVLADFNSGLTRLLEYGDSLAQRITCFLLAHWFPKKLVKKLLFAVPDPHKPDQYVFASSLLPAASDSNPPTPRLSKQSSSVPPQLPSSPHLAGNSQTAQTILFAFIFFSTLIFGFLPALRAYLI